METYSSRSSETRLGTASVLSDPPFCSIPGSFSQLVVQGSLDSTLLFYLKNRINVVTAKDLKHRLHKYDVSTKKEERTALAKSPKFDSLLHVHSNYFVVFAKNVLCGFKIRTGSTNFIVSAQAGICW